LGINVPVSYGYVNDYAKVMSANERTALEKELSSFAQKNGKDIYVLVVPGLQGKTAREYITQTFEEWRVGKSSLDEGVLVLIAPYDRVVIVETGYLLKNVVPEETIKGIIDQKILPEFQKSNYDGGIKNGVGALEKVINGEEIYLEDNTSLLNAGVMIVITLIAIYIFYLIISRILLKKRDSKKIKKNRRYAKRNSYSR